jgi:hypothetical protein
VRSRETGPYAKGGPFDGQAIEVIPDRFGRPPQEWSGLTIENGRAQKHRYWARAAGAYYQYTSSEPLNERPSYRPSY